MKRWNFGGLRATHGVSVSHRSPSVRPAAPGSRQDLQGQEDGRPSGRRARHHAEPQVVQTDVERGLILVEGAVPGAKGGWITVRDAVKKALPKDAPKPGKFRGPGGCDAGGASPAAAAAARPKPKEGA
jgi:large subunit ribosomal protein L3